MGYSNMGCAKAHHDGRAEQTMSKKIELTRRRVLSGLGTIGLAGAAAGLGTSAYLNDSESFDNNTLTAGTLNLQIDYQWAAVDSFHLAQNGGNLPTPSDPDWGTLDGNSVTLEASDVKPGDWAVLCFRIRVLGNPAYVKANGEITENGEVDVNEPEYYHSNDLNNSTNDPVNGTPNFPIAKSNTEHGELADAIQVSVGTGYSSGTLQNATTVGSLETFINTLNGWVLRGPGGMSDTGNATVVGDGAESYIPFCIMLKIPTDVGNEIQSDTVTFDLGFDAVQTRHNNETSPNFQNQS